VKTPPPKPRQGPGSILDPLPCRGGRGLPNCKLTRSGRANEALLGLDTVSPGQPMSGLRRGRDSQQLLSRSLHQGSSGLCCNLYDCFLEVILSTAIPTDRLWARLTSAMWCLNACLKSSPLIGLPKPTLLCCRGPGVAFRCRMLAYSSVRAYGQEDSRLAHHCTRPALVPD
jgi:hypothetical protein